MDSLESWMALFAGLTLGSLLLAWGVGCALYDGIDGGEDEYRIGEEDER